jgi:hypothetical protein
MMTADKYKELAAELRSRALIVESPAFRKELEDLARCYESAATDLATSDLNRVA